MKRRKQMKTTLRVSASAAGGMDDVAIAMVGKGERGTGLGGR